MPSSKKDLQQKQKTGDIGRRYEERAALFFEQKGFQVRRRNWRAGRKEIDLIVQKGELVVFVEVKASRTTSFGHPAEKIDRRKIENITMVARRYLIDEKIEGADLRFDVVTFVGDKLEHFPGAFDAAE